MTRVLKTRFGEFSLTRKDTVMVSVVEAKHDVIHKKKRLNQGDLTIVEHRKWPVKLEQVACSWGTYITTFDLKGKEWLSHTTS